jgi:hypothetical protein
MILCAFLFALALTASFVQEEPDSDETVYLAMAEAWAREGDGPYTGFFHAHPPGLLAPAAGLFAFVPPSIQAGRVLSLLSLVSLFVILLVFARRIEKEEGRPGTMIFSGTLFLTSPLVHLVGAAYLGLNLPAVLVLAAFLFHAKDRPGFSGFVTGLSLAVRLSTAPCALYLAVMNRRKPGYFLGVATGALPLLLSLGLWSGCFDQTILYHLRKESMLFGSRLAVLGEFVYEEKVLLLFAIPALFFLRGGKSRSLLVAGFLVLLFASLQKVVWPYYFHLAVPLLCIPAAAWISDLIGKRIEGRMLVFPNLAILLAAIAANSMVIMPRLQPDRNLLPLVEKVGALSGGRGEILDLSGGGKGCYVACKTDLAVAGGHFDMSLHRFASGSLSQDGLISTLSRKPDVVLTEIESRGRTILWSRLPKVRGALLGLGEGDGYRPADIMVRSNDLSLVVMWVPQNHGAPGPPGETLEDHSRKWRFWYVRSTAGRRTTEVTHVADYGMGGPEIPEAIEKLTDGPGRLLARGVFLPPDERQVRWRADDAREGEGITSRVWTQSGAGRVLIETVYEGNFYRPLSFADVGFEPETGRMTYLRIFGEVGRGFVPVVSIRPSEEVDSAPTPP